MKHDLPLPRTVATLPLSNTCKRTCVSKQQKYKANVLLKQPTSNVFEYFGYKGE
jgi:hypothetical protein